MGRRIPAVGSAGARLQRLALAKLDWLVVRDLTVIESAAFWKNSPEIATGELRTDRIGTEVFFMPAASHVEKDGTFTNTQRMLQWHHQGAGAARRRPQRPVVRVSPGQADPRPAGRLRRRARPPASRT